MGQVVEIKRKSMGRASVSAADMAPLVRDMAARDLFYRKNSEAVAVSHANGRLHIVDCGLVNLDQRLRRVEIKLGLVPGFFGRAA